MMTATQLLLAALAASAPANQGQAQGGVAVSNSPPPRIITVPWPPSAPLPQPALAPAPPPPLPVVATPPQARGPAQSLISPDDYPMSALANREQGRVEFRLDVGPSGRVHDCTITRSSGSKLLDATTCRILRARSRYTPARDSNGMPVGYPVEDGVEWRLPGKGGERG